jgi:hypothetical protein
MDNLTVLGKKVPLKVKSDKWEISITTHKGQKMFHFVRYVNGRYLESYRPVTSDVASIWAVSICTGYKPPKALMTQKDDDWEFIPIKSKGKK